MPEPASQQDMQAGEIGTPESVTKISGGDQRIASQHADTKAKDEIILARLSCSILRCRGFDFRDFETQVGVATVSKAFRSANRKSRGPWPTGGARSTVRCGGRKKTSTRLPRASE